MSVVVLCPNGRRVKVPVTPNTNILEILEKACTTQGLNSEEFELHHSKRKLDASLPFRFANVPNNAELVLKEANVKRNSTANVTVALQLESGERCLGDFKPDETLWNICDALLQNKIGCSETATCIYMQKQVSGEAQLKETKLRSLGITSGKVVLRVLLKQAESISQSYSEAVKTEKPSVEKSPEVLEESNRVTSLEKVEPQPSKPVEYKDPDPSAFSFATEETTLDPSAISNLLKEREAMFIKFEEMPTLNFEPLPDEFYEVTKDDVVYCYKVLKKEVNERPLETREMRERQARVKLQKYPKTVLRVCFPYDKIMLQAVFNSEDTIATVKSYVGKFLENNVKFDLYVTPPKQLLKDDQSLFQYGLPPAAVVHFGAPVQAPVLGSAIKTNTVDYQKVSEAAYVHRKPSSVIVSEDMGMETEELQHPVPIVEPQNVTPQNQERVASSRPSSTAPVPKWFKLRK